MAVSITVDKLEDDGTILVRHIFFGETESEARETMLEHAEGCKAFGPALKDDRVIETVDEDAEIPEWEDGDNDGV